MRVEWRPLLSRALPTSGIGAGPSGRFNCPIHTGGGVRAHPALAVIFNLTAARVSYHTLKGTRKSHQKAESALPDGMCLI